MKFADLPKLEGSVFVGFAIFARFTVSSWSQLFYSRLSIIMNLEAHEEEAQKGAQRLEACFGSASYLFVVGNEIDPLH